ncbi:MAG: beta-ketoacyl synthase N-terminal-like domain-containing protein, partial [Solirubrobacteraceae bacterium]|nr:beta-ketoacyl synthase N-terminal-like domain-containing protein [Solirubrobacteraceae bacterium]
MPPNHTPTSHRRRSPGGWLLLPRAERRSHVVCFPHAGGGASFYRPWIRRFPADVAFSIVDYPGREERLDAPLQDDLGIVADGIAEDLLAIDAGPLQLFGHSMGSAIAFEVALRIERERPGSLRRLVVSARPAPVACRPPLVSHLGDDALAAQIAAMGGTDEALLRDPEVRELVLPIIRNDYRLLERHRPDPAQRIDADVLVLGGADDPTVTADELASWAGVTRGRAHRRTFAGGHFYLLDAAADVVAELAAPTTTGDPLDPPGPPDDAPRPQIDQAAAAPTAGTTRAATRPAPAIDPAEPRDPAELVAIVGMSGRFPGAPDVDALWELLRDGREALGEPSDDELLAAGVAAEALADPRFVRRFGALDDVDRFDAGFFGFSAREADLLDPQHRLFLECAWEALEDAGHDPRRTSGSIGLYAGCGVSTYLLAQVLPARGTVRSVGEFAALMAAERDFLAARASYKLDLRGPSATVLSGCSTGLFAVHLAAQGILSGEADMALAGGATVFFPRPSGHIHEDGSIRSADGRCHAFGAEAAGTAAGEAVGVVLLRRLDEALADGDRILGVLRGSACNNDGASGKAGFTAPSVRGQRDVIREALAVAGVPPGAIDYVEAHGTGTPLGDPIEVEALAEALGDLPTGSVRIGSVKPNVGHTDTAAGVVGLIKVLLALREEELPPSINGTPVNPALELAQTPLTLCDRRTPWPCRPGRPRRAGVSSFSVGGTNVHVVVEEPPALPARPPDDPAEHLLVLSARGPRALNEAVERLAAHLEAGPRRDLGDVARTLAIGRARFSHRAAVAVRAGEDAATVLR